MEILLHGTDNKTRAADPAWITAGWCDNTTFSVDVLDGPMVNLAASCFRAKGAQVWGVGTTPFYASMASMGFKSCPTTQQLLTLCEGEHHMPAA